MRPELRTSLLAIALAGAPAATTVAQAPTPLAQRHPPVLTAFAINDGAAAASALAALAALALVHTATGTPPSHYRVSTRADFAGAAWLPWSARPSLDARPLRLEPGCDAPGSTHRVRLFLQVRSTGGEEVRVVAGRRTLVPVPLESNVLADSICVGAPAPR